MSALWTAAWLVDRWAATKAALTAGRSVESTAAQMVAHLVGKKVVSSAVQRAGKSVHPMADSWVVHSVVCLAETTVDQMAEQKAASRAVHLVELLVAS